MPDRAGARRSRSGPIAGAGIAAVAGLLLWEHRLVRADDLSRIDAAFFTMNGYVSVIFFLFWATDIFCLIMTPVFEDPRLMPIRDKVEAGERLDFDDGVTLYRTPDLLGVGWMANQVRERLHGDKTYFNVNRHINPTDVCVASCQLVRLRQARDPRPTPCRSNRCGNAPATATAKRSPNSTSSAACIPN